MKRGLSEACHLFFSTLSNPTRLAILELLRNGPKNVTEISDVLNQEQSMISHNLKPLIRCKFVFVERKWKERIYTLNEDTMKSLFDIIERHAVLFGKLSKLRAGESFTFINDHEPRPLP